MTNRSPHTAYIQDVEEYLSVIEDRLQEAVKRAVHAQDQHAADKIGQMQEIATDLHLRVYAFLTNLKADSPFWISPSQTKTPTPTPIGYECRDLSQIRGEEDLGIEEDDDEDRLSGRITLIPDMDDEDRS